MKNHSHQYRSQMRKAAAGICVRCPNPTAVGKLECDACASKRGVKKRRIPLARWLAVHWSLPIKEIAGLLGVTTTTVTNARKSLGLPKAYRWTNVDWSKTDEELAKKNAVSEYYVSRMRKKHCGTHWPEVEITVEGEE